MASEVNDFEGLCNLIILEQFKNTLPGQVATYLAERRVITVLEAACLADEHVLVHKNHFKCFGKPGGYRSDAKSLDVSARFTVQGPRAVSSSGRDVCNYCQESGHWKVNCPVLLARDCSGEGKRVNPVALAASLPVPLGLDMGCDEYVECGMVDGLKKSLLPFVRVGLLPCLGGTQKSQSGS